MYISSYSPDIWRRRWIVSISIFFGLGQIFNIFTGFARSTAEFDAMMICQVVSLGLCVVLLLLCALRWLGQAVFIANEMNPDDQVVISYLSLLVMASMVLCGTSLASVGRHWYEEQASELMSDTYTTGVLAVVCIVLNDLVLKREIASIQVCKRTDKDVLLFYILLICVCSRLRSWS